MTSNYVQKVDVKLPDGARLNQVLGIVLQLVGLGLIAAAVFGSYYVFIAVGVFLIAGIVLTQRFYSTAKSFEYDYNETRLVIARSNILGHKRRLLEIVYSDVTEFTVFRDAVSHDDIVAAADVHSDDVKAVVFAAEGKTYRLLFSPDEYLTILLSDRLRSGDK